MCQGIYGLSGLEKINSIAYLEVKLVAENPCQGEILNTFRKLKISEFTNVGTYPLDVWYTVRDFIAD